MAKYGPRMCHCINCHISEKSYFPKFDSSFTKHGIIFARICLSNCIQVHVWHNVTVFCHCSNHCAQPKQEYFKHRVWEYAVYSSTGEAFPLWALASNCCLLSSPSSKAVKRKMRLEIFRAPAFCWKWGERKEGERLIACKSTLVACKNIWSKYVGKRPCIFAQFASMWSKVVISWKLWLMLISF